MHLFYCYLIALIIPSHEAVSLETCLSTEESKLFELVNSYRKEKGLKPIPFSSKLTRVAQAHAIDLAHNYSFNPDGNCNPHSWSKNGNWTSCCYTNDHKKAQCMWDKPREIANYKGDGYEIAYYSSAGANAQEGMRGWKKSPGHNPLLVNLGIWKEVKWKAVGVGIYKEYAVVWFGAVEDESKVIVCI